MSNVTTLEGGQKPLETANDYLIDASDYVAVLKSFLNCENDFDPSRGAVVCKEIGRLIEAAREIVVDH